MKRAGVRQGWGPQALLLLPGCSPDHERILTSRKRERGSSGKHVPKMWPWFAHITSRGVLLTITLSHGLSTLDGDLNVLLPHGTKDRVSGWWINRKGREGDRDTHLSLAQTSWHDEHPRALVFLGKSSSLPVDSRDHKVLVNSFLTWVAYAVLNLPGLSASWPLNKGIEFKLTSFVFRELPVAPCNEIFLFVFKNVLWNLLRIEIKFSNLCWINSAFLITLFENPNIYLSSCFQPLLLPGLLKGRTKHSAFFFFKSSGYPATYQPEVKSLQSC